MPGNHCRPQALYPTVPCSDIKRRLPPPGRSRRLPFALALVATAVVAASCGSAPAGNAATVVGRAGTVEVIHPFV
ncbi:MAG: hypothetical protein M3Y36_07635, partial [Actinomycetota bacterium]|nr:hypothetical protein [Actinomycetota bacterium]